MYPVPKESVMALIESAGGRVLAVDADNMAEDFYSFNYFLKKDGPA
jgi:hypothetical protein